MPADVPWWNDDARRDIAFNAGNDRYLLHSLFTQCWLLMHDQYPSRVHWVDVNLNLGWHLIKLDRLEFRGEETVMHGKIRHSEIRGTKDLVIKGKRDVCGVYYHFYIRR